MNLSENLKKIRKDNNLSQEQLAEKLGVSRQSVSKWESNQAYPEMDKVLQICQMFNLNVDELLNQNLKEVKDKKDSKNSINKYIDDFLAFLTKTVDMFSSLKFKDKLKCLFEQFIICVLLFIMFLIIGSVGTFIVSNIFDVLPYNIYSVVFSLLEGLYIIVAIIIGIVILLHIFKIRYLDYYVIVKNVKEENNEPIETTKEKIYLEKKEKVIIRDPNHSGYRFIKGLLKSVLFFIKLFAILIAISFLATLIVFVICLVLIFLFIDTGLVFIGTLITLISAIVINLLLIYIIYSFIFNKKIKRNLSTLIFIVSIIVLSIGIGLTLIGIKDFNIIHTNTKDFIKEEKVIMMNNDLLLDDYYFYLDIEYIENDSNEVKVICEHHKNFNCEINVINNRIYTNFYSKDMKIMDQLRQIISDINNKELIDYSNYKIKVYTSKNNIEKLKSNIVNYINHQEEIERQNEINYYENMIQEQQNKIYELEEEIIEKDNLIEQLKKYE